MAKLNAALSLMPTTVEVSLLDHEHGFNAVNSSSQSTTTSRSESTKWSMSRVTRVTRRSQQDARGPGSPSRRAASRHEDSNVIGSID